MSNARSPPGAVVHAGRRRRLRLIPWVPGLILFALCAIAVLAPLIAPYPPLQGSLGDKLLPPAWLAGGAWSHPLGTDLLGRDILSRLFYGARTSWRRGHCSAGAPEPSARASASSPAICGGALDAFLMRLTDVALSLPLILVAIVLVAALGTSFTNVVSSSCLLLWPRYARQIRG